MKAFLFKVLRASAICVPCLVSSSYSLAKPTSSHAEIQDNKQLLGFVELNKTTLKEFTTKLEAQGCKITFDKGMAQVDAGCIQLPGDPKIRAITHLKEDSKASPWESLDSLQKMPADWADLPIESLALCTRNYGAWKDYLESLTKSWGKPNTIEGYDGASGSLALWKKNDFDVELKRVSGYTWITYVSSTRMQRLKDLQLSQEKVRQKNLDLL